MSTTLHVGRHLIQTSKDDSGNPLTGTISATATPPGIVGITVIPTGNSIRLDGLAVGSATITYSDPGYTNAVDVVNVIAPPQIVMTDGPEQ